MSSAKETSVWLLPPCYGLMWLAVYCSFTALVVYFSLSLIVTADYLVCIDHLMFTLLPSILFFVRCAFWEVHLFCSALWRQFNFMSSSPARRAVAGTAVGNHILFTFTCARIKRTQSLPLVTDTLKIRQNSVCKLINTMTSNNNRNTFMGKIFVSPGLVGVKVAFVPP